MIQSRDHFPTWLTEHGLIGTGVEVGVYYGRNAEHILKNWPGKLVGVDPYQHYPEDEWLDGCNLVDLDEVMRDALKLLEPFLGRFRIIRKRSIEAAAEFGDSALDFCYIDANHDYKHVREDISAWWPKVTRSGVIGGHDFMTRNDDQQRCGVEQAVNEFAGDHPELWLEKTNCTSWFIRRR